MARGMFKHLIATLCLSALFSAHISASDLPPSTLEQHSDQERTVSLSVSVGGCNADTLLAANNTTPYRWVIIGEGDSSVATLKLDYEAPDPIEQGGAVLCGAPGKLRVSVIGHRTGVTEYVLGYTHLADRHARPARKLTLHITVTPSK